MDQKPPDTNRGTNIPPEDRPSGPHPDWRNRKGRMITQDRLAGPEQLRKMRGFPAARPLPNRPERGWGPTWPAPRSDRCRGLNRRREIGLEKKPASFPLAGVCICISVVPRWGSETDRDTRSVPTAGGLTPTRASRDRRALPSRRPPPLPPAAHPCPPRQTPSGESSGCGAAASAAPSTQSAGFARGSP